MKPITINRNEHERVFIEPSINSIRFSIKMKTSDELEKLLVYKFSQFYQARAESFLILRKTPVKGFDLSFLITNHHLDDKMIKNKVVDFIISFLEAFDKEISEMKINMNARARIVAEEFLKQLA